MNPQIKYKRYRVYINSPTGQYIVATSNTVNDLVDLTRMWLTQTSPGLYMPDKVSGYLVVQRLDEETGAYRGGEQMPFESKDEIITILRKLGGR